MITQNPSSYTNLPPIYYENLAQGPTPFLTHHAVTPKISPKTADLHVSPASIALILLGFLIATTILFYWKSLNKYKRTPTKDLIHTIDNDPAIKPRLRTG